MKKRVLIAVLSCLFSLSAHAFFLNQMQLLNFMSSSNPMHRAAAEMYVVGIADVLIADRLMCVPVGLNSQTLFNIVFNSLSRLPEDGQHIVSWIVRLQLLRHYPCGVDSIK